MNPNPNVGPHRNEAELARFTAIISDAFASPPDRAGPYFDSVGRENLRLIRRNGEVAGGLALLPKGQFFGGRSVPMTGVAVVAVAPEYRATGAATEVLRASLEELYAAEVPLSTLYPATVQLYRRVGYELAGLAGEVTMPAKSVDVRDRRLGLRRATEADEPAIRACYRAWAAQASGNLDRNAFNWQRTREVRGEHADGYVIEHDGGLEGYAFVLPQATADPFRWNTRVLDMAITTPDAARRLLTLLADFRTTRDQIVFRSGPADPLLVHLPEAPYTLTSRAPWMLRVVHVRRALEERGYPAGLKVELHLDVRDDLLPGNNGRLVLRIANGRGTVEPGGQGALELDVRGLAALYTGYLSGRDLVLAGRAQGVAEALDVAGAAFSGPLPWMRDAF